MSLFTMYTGHMDMWPGMVTDFTSSSTTGGPVYSNTWNVVIIPYTCEYNPIKYLLGCVHAYWHLLVLYPSDLTHTLWVGQQASCRHKLHPSVICAMVGQEVSLWNYNHHFPASPLKAACYREWEAKDNRVISINPLWPCALDRDWWMSTCAQTCGRVNHTEFNSKVSFPIYAKPAYKQLWVDITNPNQQCINPLDWLV